MNAITLTEDEQQPVATLAQAYADVMPGGRSCAYRALAATAAEGSVPGELVPLLERVCTLSLQTGRARDLGRAEFERALMAVFRRTPGGRSLLGQVDEVNRALGVFAGAPLRSARVAMSLPGRYVLCIESGDMVIRLQVCLEGVTIQSLTLG
jgi:hypothetical protein